MARLWCLKGDMSLLIYRQLNLLIKVVGHDEPALWKVKSVKQVDKAVSLNMLETL